MAMLVPFVGIENGQACLIPGGPPKSPAFPALTLPNSADSEGMRHLQPLTHAQRSENIYTVIPALLPSDT